LIETSGCGGGGGTRKLFTGAGVRIAFDPVKPQLVEPSVALI